MYVRVRVCVRARVRACVRAAHLGEAQWIAVDVKDVERHRRLSQGAQKDEQFIGRDEPKVADEDLRQHARHGLMSSR